MIFSFQARSHMDEFIKHRGWFIALGICLGILGTCAIYAAVFSTMISVIILGSIFTIASAFMLVDTFKFWLHKGISFFIHLIFSLLYLLAGLSLIFTPITGAITLTLLLGIFFIGIGIIRIIISLYLKLPRWGWMLFNGIITTILGILILSQWPTSGLYIIGLFVGIDIALIGWTYIMLGIFLHSDQKMSNQP